jgi:hypothetical protein
MEGGGAVGCDCEFCGFLLRGWGFWMVWIGSLAFMGLKTNLMYSQHVGAAAAGFQQELVNQLKAPGR